MALVLSVPPPANPQPERGLQRPSPRILFVMIDGFGVHPDGVAETVYPLYCSRRFLSLLENDAVLIDATLGVDGIPQSGTGQTTLFTGINAAKKIGAHSQAFPGPSLRKIIRGDNILKTLSKTGKRVTFANAYARHSVAELKKRKMFSVTSVMTENAIGSFRDGDDLAAGDAVYHDLTRHTLADLDLPAISPEQAADDLLRISREFNFTLFEHFLTDVAGHKRKSHLLRKNLRNVDRFVVHLVDHLEDATLILTSDHGNCEDASTPNHTRNPVPLLIVGRHRPERIDAVSIADVHDLVVSMTRTSSEPR